MRVVRVAVVVAVAWLVAVVGLPVDAGTPVAGAAQEAGAGIDPGPRARPPVPVDAPAAPAGEDDAPFVAPDVVVPRAGTATVVLGTRATPAGDLPVAVGPARGAPRDAERASVRVTTLDQATVRRVGARFLAFTLTSRTARSASLEVDYGGFATRSAATSRPGCASCGSRRAPSSGPPTGRAPRRPRSRRPTTWRRPRCRRRR